MPVFALWSAPRARSTAFFRSMVERGDLVALHEPFCNIADFGEAKVAGRTFDSSASLLTWLLDGAIELNVFLKETTDRRHDDVLADERFLAEARHAFLIRRPEEIAASYYALRPEMRVDEIGLEALYNLYSAVLATGNNRAIVIDSDDLVAEPEATMAAYCASVDLPFIRAALTWEPGERSEWRARARWHSDASSSSGFGRRNRVYTDNVDNNDQLARFAAHHLPFYKKLYAQRLDVAA